jgi:hypothetical protein
MEHNDLTILSKLKLYQSFSYAKMVANSVNYYDRAKRQATVSTPDAYCFYSYETLIAINMNGQMYITPEWDYSNTTRKYRMKFLHEGSATTRVNLQYSTYIYLDHHWSL